MKKTMFLKNAKLLNDEFGIVPLMYGSLGLEYITNENLNADDIDILIPQAFIHEKWDEFKRILINHGYVLVDEHEHTFQINGFHCSYASLEELESFAGINLMEISEQNQDDVQFKVLSLEQYLNVYTASAKDGYRINVRQKKDNEKISFINTHLK